MSTGAEIRTPWQVTYYTHEGGREEVLPFLRQEIEKAKEDEDDPFLTALEQQFDKHVNSQDHMLNREGSGGAHYTYEIDAEGDISVEETRY